MQDSIMQTIRRDIEALKKLDPQRKAFLFALGFVLFIVSILVGAYLSRNTVVQKAQPSPAISRPVRQTTSLSIEPAKADLKVGTTQTIEVKLSELPVTAIDLVIVYDPKQLAVTNVRQGTIFDRTIRNTNVNGIISFSASINPDNAATAREGTVISFDVRPLVETPTATISFDQDKTITALNGDNTLGLTTGGIYRIAK